MPTNPNVTSKILFNALKRKYAKTQAAVLGEVTMEDEDEAHRVRTYHVKQRYGHYYKDSYDKHGLAYDAELPDGYNPDTVKTVRRIDALIFESNTRTAVEIKISRADFFRDTDAKRAAWMKHTDRFIYLTPKGLINKEEIPEGCGLWEYENGKITVTKRATINKNVQDFPQSMFKYFAWRAFIAEKRIGK
jgi:hypothetical protein